MPPFSEYYLRFFPEDGGSRFHWNAGKNPLDYTVPYDKGDVDILKSKSLWDLQKHPVQEY